MKVAVAYEVDEPLVVEDLPTPAIGPEDVLVCLAASGICHTDLTVIEGQSYLPLPIVLGHEACGVVEAIGSDLQRAKVGNRVLASVSPARGRCWWYRMACRTSARSARPFSPRSATSSRTVAPPRRCAAAAHSPRRWW